MKSITRRAALKGSAATVAASAVAVPSFAHAEGDDSELIALLNKWRGIGDEIDACMDERSTERLNERMTAIFGRINETEEAIARTPARSPEGIAGKLEILKGWVDAGPPDSGIDQRLLASAMKDLAVIGGAS